MFKVTFDSGAFRSRAKRSKEMLLIACEAATNDALDVARRHAQSTDLFQNRSGQLRKGTVTEPARKRSGNWFEGVLKNAVKWARHIDEGTKRHWIHPRRPGGRLRFWWERKNKWFDGDPGQAVNHPGIQPTHFMSIAAMRGYYALREGLERRIERVQKLWW